MPLSIAFGPAWLTRDARIVITTRALRTFGYGSTSVVLAAMLTEDGDSPAQIGLLLAVAAIGSVLASILMGLFADRFGRRSSLLVLPGAPLLSSSPLSHLVAEFLGAGTISTFPRLRASTTPGVPLCLSSRRVRGRRLDRGGSGK
jgi:MFS family permease